jgi:hypothetical protein
MAALSGRFSGPVPDWERRGACPRFGILSARSSGPVPDRERDLSPIQIFRTLCADSFALDRARPRFLGRGYSSEEGPNRKKSSTKKSSIELNRDGHSIIKRHSGLIPYDDF